jgi:hypothetical protein
VRTDTPGTNDSLLPCCDDITDISIHFAITAPVIDLLSKLYSATKAGQKTCNEKGAELPNMLVKRRFNVALELQQISQFGLSNSRQSRGSKQSDL